MNAGNSVENRFSPGQAAGDLSGAEQPDGVSSGLRVLLIDDNRQVADALGIAFRLAGHRLDAAVGVEEGLSRLAAAAYGAVLLDLNYAPGRTDGAEGLAALARILGDDPGMAVVVVTAHSGVKVAVAAMQAGARDFVMKPWRNAELIAKVVAAAARPPGAATVPPAPAAPVRILGESAAIAQLRTLIRRVGPTRADVLVTGPAGAGRSLAAAAIHAAAADADRPLRRVDLRDPAGWAGLEAMGDPVLLRYPDRLDPVAQRRLADGLHPARRCLAVADAAAAIEPALVRRLATVEIAVPPLRDRPGDAPLLARHFARLAAERHGRPMPRFTPAALALLAVAAWPDEVRGLGLAVERAVLLADGGEIDAALLAPALPAAAAVPAADARLDLALTEKAMVERALRTHGHNVSRAAAALGLSRGALYRRMALHGL